MPQVLVLTPTRELAIQVADAFRRYAANLTGLRVVPIYGGQDYPFNFGNSIVVSISWWELRAGSWTT